MVQVKRHAIEQKIIRHQPIGFCSQTIFVCAAFSISLINRIIR